MEKWNGDVWNEEMEMTGERMEKWRCLEREGMKEWKIVSLKEETKEDGEKIDL